MRKWELTAIIAIAAALCLGVFTGAASEHISDSVVRVHIIANSDSESDQRLKLDVRDRILRDTAPLLQQSASRQQTLDILRESIDTVTASARDEIERQGYAYAVDAYVDKRFFPTKQYGGMTLPAGQYDALCVVIGEGGGQNWWCVMFPPLCAGEVTAESQAYLRDSLTGDEYALITESDQFDVQYKFKAVELYNSAKEAVSGMFDGD